MLTPYLLYIKIGLIALAVLVIIGLGWYVKATFNERDKLLTEKATLTLQVAQEKANATAAMEQVTMWRTTVEQMTKAVRNIKIQSDTYIQGVENSEKPNVAAGAHVPFIVPAMSTNPILPRFEGNSSGRVRTPTPNR